MSLPQRRRPPYRRLVNSYSLIVRSPTLAITRAELLFMPFLVEHNITFGAADHAGKLFRDTFPDSRIVLA